MIKRVKSCNKEPEVSDNQRQMLMDEIARRVAETHNLAEYDPVIAMALIATDPEVNGINKLTGERTTYIDHEGREKLTQRDLGLALAAHREVAKYTRPQLKQVELVGSGGGPLEIKTELAINVANLIQEVVGIKGAKNVEDQRQRIPHSNGSTNGSGNGAARIPNKD